MISRGRCSTPVPRQFLHGSLIVTPRPWQVGVEAGVTDVNRQRWAAGASLLVHPSEVYVGLRSERGFVQAG